MTTTLPLTLRLAEPDRASLLTHFLALAPEDRRLRFGASVGDESIRAYIGRLDFGRDGLFAVRDAEGGLIAVVHVAIGDDTAELGLSVLPAYREEGNGGALFARAVDFLRNRGIGEVHVQCLAENAAMRHLASRHGMRISSQGGESEGRLVLRAPTSESYFREWLHDQQAAAIEVMRRNARVARMLWSLYPPVKS